METELEVKLDSNDEVKSDDLPGYYDFIMVKSAFFAWLSSRKIKQGDLDNIIRSLDNASEQLLRRKISYAPLWEITKHSAFEDIYKKAMDNKFFRILDRKTCSAFFRDGQLYLKFLKSKPVFHRKISGVISANDENLTARMTIKDAIIKVLEAEERAMTVEEIYSSIIKQNLHTFGAQNPVKVVRTTIEYACENSGYSNKDPIPCFCIERNDDDKRIYSLVELEPYQDTSEHNYHFVETSSESDFLKMGIVNIWNESVEKRFQEWLEYENYAKKTAQNYRRAVKQIFRNYSELAQKSANDSHGTLEVIRKYIVLLNNDSSFRGANSSRHNQFTASLSAFERFYASEFQKVESKACEYIHEQPDAKSISPSPLDCIIDLDEGKSGIQQILEAHFQTLYGYSNIGILWNAAQDALSMFLNDNAINDADDLWRFMRQAFSDEYVLNNPHIWKTVPNYPQSYVGVIINLTRHYGGTITREQIDDYFAQIKQGSPINATIIRQGLLLFYASRTFILTETIDLTSERCVAVTKALDRLFAGEKVPYIILRDITEEWFSSLPTIKGDIPWTAILLQEMLRLHRNIGYRIIFSGLDGQALDTLGAAIVNAKSEITSFADVIHRYCFEKDLLSKRMLTEDLRIILRNAGMLEGNELIYNLHKALKDYRFAFTDENRTVKILER
ncbi:hypothetical protein [Parasporobacterium paucivorans]|uniref:Core-binding (CB) domain-containing protein n=1 Tax=Parasporobacterium paucivorans DSM 15970 TaxID=1122934 RepID=A0A1M6AZZ2_9FIRM|nr:hypothetical protein [Parasporobacterium paucivorans]SHI42040.1 hypothetical protein SAMN02745691_00224 [Parasporobacterium paucivorans DSM 15970]